MKNRLLMFLIIALVPLQQRAMNVCRAKSSKLLCLAALVLPFCAAGQSQNATVSDTLINQGILPTLGQVVYLSAASASWIRDLVHGNLEPDFCDYEPAALEPPFSTIDDAAVQAEDYEGLIPSIKKYAPVVYLDKKEAYMPIQLNEWYFGPHTALVTQADYVQVPPGKITMPLLAACAESLNNSSSQDVALCQSLYLKNPSCMDYGSDPQKNLDAAGNLTTPCYVVTSQTETHIYLQYIFIYGFNGPFGIGPFEGDIMPVQDAHEFDLEHVDLELDSATKELTRIFYSSHGTYEGFWIDASHPDVYYEDGHPVVFSARGSHGNYNQAGTYVRIYGVANDKTSYGLRWVPQMVRLYSPYDSRFNLSSMAWATFEGSMGPRGGRTPWNHYWFTRPLTWDIGQSYESVLFCNATARNNNGIHALAAALQQITCILTKIPQATTPKG